MNDKINKLKNVENWIFDLDDTLYSASTTLFEQIEIKIRDYISEFLKITPEEAFKLQKGFYQKYGTTLRGMVLEKGMNPEDYIDKVHDLDLSVLSENPELDNVLSLLNGRKFVFTNGSKEHGERVTEKLGIKRHFEGFFGVREGLFIPKPEKSTYELMVETYNIDPSKTAIFEDSQRNLKPAHEMGMVTIWITNPADKLTPIENNPKYCDFVTDDLVGWIKDYCI